jgi:hypothetical protein
MELAIRLIIYFKELLRQWYGALPLFPLKVVSKTLTCVVPLVELAMHTKVVWQFSVHPSRIRMAGNEFPWPKGMSVTRMVRCASLPKHEVVAHHVFRSALESKSFLTRSTPETRTPCFPISFSWNEEFGN